MNEQLPTRDDHISDIGALYEEPVRLPVAPTRLLHMLRRAAEQSAAGVLVIDPSYRVSYANAAFCAMIRCSSERLVGKPIQELYASAGDDIAEVYATLAAQSIWHGQLRYHCGSQQMRLCQVSAFAAAAPESSTFDVVHIVVDPLKPASACSGAPNLVAQTVWEQFPLGVFVQDQQRRLVFVNQALAQALATSRDEMLGQTIYELLPDAERNIWQRHDDHLYATGEIIEREMTLVLHGPPYKVHALKFPLYNQRGAVWALGAIVTSVPDRTHGEAAELRRYIRQLDALHTTMTEISGELELNRLLHALLERSVDLLDAIDAQLCVYDEATGDMRVLLVHGLPDRYIGMHIAHGQGAVGQVATTRAPLIIDDYMAWEHRLSSYEPLGLKSLLLVPLLAGEHLLGVLSVGDTRRIDRFTNSDTKILTLFAQQATMAIQNARLYEDARLRAEEAETLRRAGAAVTATLDQQEAIDRLLEQLELVVPYDSASVQIRYGNRSEIVGGRGFADPDAVLGLSFALDGDHPNPARLVYQNRCAHILSDAPAAYAIFREPPHSHIRSWLGVPLILHDTVIGMLALDSTARQHFTAHHARLVSAFADQVAIALEHARLFAEVQLYATTDPLLGIFNRRHFFALAGREFERSRRYVHALSIIMIDIDNFKKINDAYGHSAGDQVLQEVTNLCVATLRNADVAGRYGGEEIVIMLPETDAPGAYQVAERLRRIVLETPVIIGQGSLLLTVSVGVATFHGEEGLNLDQLIDRADQALYVAKHTVKNHVGVWRDGLRIPQSKAADPQVEMAELLQVYEETVQGWSRMMRLHSAPLEDQLDRTVHLAVQLGRCLGLSDEELVNLRWGALLHDIGMLALPTTLLHKRTPLTPREHTLLRQHPDQAYDLLLPIPFLHPAMSIPYCHHEHWDGSGYPRGLHGTEIPLHARLFAVVDVWHVLRSERPYRAARSAAQAREHLVGQAGAQFDPDIVAAFLSLLIELDGLETSI